MNKDEELVLVRKERLDLATELARVRADNISLKAELSGVRLELHLAHLWWWQRIAYWWDRNHAKYVHE